ncbi:MAG: sirohydrochlorin cobaltochelatase [Veillonella sp.]|nr:sirohydrochlorin cobaltochelatase [Veillonella sp.]
MSRRGIIITSFGSVYKEAVDKSVVALVKDIQQAYPHDQVCLAFLSPALVEKWNSQEAEPVFSLEAALEHLEAQGIREVYIQPMTLVNDPCYQDLRRFVSKALRSHTYDFDKLFVGRPLLSSLGVKNHIDDYENTIEAILRHINGQAINKTILLMANGNAQLEYSTLQLKAIYNNINNLVVFTANGFPNFKQSLQMIRRAGHDQVLVVPLAMIGSSHLMDYLGGSRSDSVATLLTEQGYSVSIWNQGLGENDGIRALFMRHLQQMIRRVERYGDGTSLEKVEIKHRETLGEGAESNLHAV